MKPYTITAIAAQLACSTLWAQTNSFPLYSYGAYSGGGGDNTTTVTNAQLKLASSSGFVRVLHLSTDPGNSAVYNYQTGKNVYWGESTDAGSYIFRGRHLTVQEGNLGVGVIPQYKLHVNGRAAAGTFRLLENGDNILESFDNGQLHHLIGTYRGWDSKAVYIAGANASNTASTGYAAVSERVNIGNPTYSNKYLSVNLLTGGVGIGTAPQARLHILENTNTASLVLESNSTGLGSGMYFKNTAASGKTYGLYASSMGNFTLTDVTTSSDRLFISATGNIGVNTHNVNDANYKFFVEGAIKARKITVDHLTWPDTVFSNTYRLPSLGEIEKFILQNKHLPDVPSAADVEKNGIDLGDNQAVLLKKIEELTLYVININKKNEQLQQQVNNLNAALVKMQKDTCR